MHSIYQWIWVSGAVLMLIMSGGPLIWAAMLWFHRAQPRALNVGQFSRRPIGFDVMTLRSAANGSQKRGALGPRETA